MRDITDLVRCTEAANAVRDLYDSGLLINVSGVGGASVLMPNEAFNDFFPAHEVGKITINSDGVPFRVNRAEFLGVRFTCVEYVEADDGLGST